jgi:hypothetical protein
VRRRRAAAKKKTPSSTSSANSRWPHRQIPGLAGLKKIKSVPGETPSALDFSPDQHLERPMLDRSHTANLFSENAQQADELAGAADAAVERPAASPETDEAEAQLDVSRSTTAPPRPRRPRPVDGGRRGAVRSKPRVAAPKGQISLPGVPPWVRSWARRARPFAPVLLLLVILAAHPAGCARQTTRSGSLAPSTPASATPTRTHPPAGSNNATRPAQAPRPRQPRPTTTDPATSTVAARPPAYAPRGASALAAAASAQQAPAAPPTVTRTVAPISVPAASNTGGPPREGRGEGNEFGFER